MPETTQQTIDRLTKQLGEWADSPTNVNGAVIAHEGGKWCLYDSQVSQEFDSVEDLEKAVADYVAAWERA